MGKVKLKVAITSFSLAIIGINGVIIATEEVEVDGTMSNISVDGTMPNMPVSETQPDMLLTNETKPETPVNEVQQIPNISATRTMPNAPVDDAAKMLELEGAKLYKSRACNACHGDDAQTPTQPSYPKLAGQTKEYIIAQMKDFQSGERNNSSSVMMRGGMSSIRNDEEIEIIAEWLESLTTKKENHVTQQVAIIANVYMNKNCYACHGLDAKSPILPIYPKLAGQQKDYAINQMKDIKSGKRHNGNSAAMKGIMYDVSETEIEALAGWLESLD